MIRVNISVHSRQFEVNKLYGEKINDSCYIL
jgi:hypothetical protein